METPHNIVNHRVELCRTCPKPCDKQKDFAFQSEASNVCPISRWKAYRIYKKGELQGLGDAVALLAQPIAGAIDKVFKTRIKRCGACAKRKEMLNQLLPFGS